MQNISSKVIVYAYEDGSLDSNESNATNNFGNAVLSTDANRWRLYIAMASYRSV